MEESMRTIGIPLYPSTHKGLKEYKESLGVTYDEAINLLLKGVQHDKEISSK